MDMMSTHSGDRIKLLMYAAVVVLINLVSMGLFFRADLTEGDRFSLSDASESVVESLTEPLTVKVFFTGNLPAPYNNIERYLHDLLQEYAASGGRMVNYQFFDVASGEGEALRENQELARNYGIAPVQIQNIEQDEVKFQKAYMGMVLIHGDIIETMPAITSTEGLEYRITSTVRKMSRKMSTLLGLEDRIRVRLFLSSSLKAVGPYINVEGLPQLPEVIREIVEDLNESNYDRIAFESLDPSIDTEALSEAEGRNLVVLNWDSFSDRRGREIGADKGYIGLVVEHGGRSESVRLLNVIRLPLFGTQYQMQDASSIKGMLKEAVENIVNVNEEIGYLSDHGTGELGMGASIPGLQDQSEMRHLSALLSDQYAIERVSVSEGGIPEGLPSLIIAGPREPFSDYELYQIDQYLMKGRSVAVFMDSFEEVIPPQQGQMQMFQRQRPVNIPINTGLENLLRHYGVSVERSIVMDESSYKQRVPQAFGGGEQQVYYAPIIKKENINGGLAFMRNIKGLVMYKASPVSVDEKRLEETGVRATRLFSSSDRSWEMKGRVDFNPMAASVPSSEEEFRQMPMAYVLEGGFTSYFADREIPEKPAGAGDEGDAGVKTAKVQSSGATIRKGKPGRLFVIGSSEILKDNILDESGVSPNSQFVLNVLDSLNGREDYAVMRSKSQGFNPIDEVTPAVRSLIKGFNIAGLPVLVILAGIVIWTRRSMRKRLVKQMFTR